MKKMLLYSFFDGFLQGYIYLLLIEYFCSVYFAKNYFFDILLFVLLIVLSVLSTIFLARKYSAKIWMGYLISGIGMIIILLLNFVNLLTLKAHLFTIREMSNADGFVILALSLFFTAYLFIFRLFDIIISAIKEAQGRRHK